MGSVSRLCVLAAVLATGLAQEVEQARSREAKQLNEGEQKYDLELSFPVESDEATNVDDGRRARIDSLIQEILLATQVSKPAGGQYLTRGQRPGCTSNQNNTAPTAQPSQNNRAMIG